MRAIVEAELRRLGVRPRDLNVVAELGLQESSQTAVEEGLGATFTSLAAIERELELGRLASARVTGLSLRRDYVVVRQAAREPSRLATAFIAYCREAWLARLWRAAAASRGAGARSAPCRAGATRCGARGRCGRRRAGSRASRPRRARTSAPSPRGRAVLQLDVLAVHREALVEAADLVEHRRRSSRQAPSIQSHSTGVVGHVGEVVAGLGRLDVAHERAQRRAAHERAADGREAAARALQRAVALEQPRAGDAAALVRLGVRHERRAQPGSSRTSGLRMSA